MAKNSWNNSQISNQSVPNTQYETQNRKRSTGRMPSPLQCPPKSPLRNAATENFFDHNHQTSPFANYNNYAPPKSPKITTTSYDDDDDEEFDDNEDDDDDDNRTISYYQTPTSAGGGRSPKTSSDDNSIADFFSGHGHSSCPTTTSSPRRSPKSPRKFVFDAISPVMEQSFDKNLPTSPDGNKFFRNDNYFAEMNSSKFFDAGSGGRGDLTKNSGRKNWNTSGTNVGHELNECGSSGANIFIKRDSCVTDSTQLSGESNDTANGSTAMTATTTFSSSDRSKCIASGRDQFNANFSDIHQSRDKKGRRQAVHITANPGYQVLHSSHSTLDRTCSDSVVLRCRKSTSDLNATDPKDSQTSKNIGKNGNTSGILTDHKLRRRGSSKGGLAYLASRRNSRESMKSAYSNSSIFSNDEIGPLAFQASNRSRQRRTSNFLELPIPDHVRPRVCSLPDRPYNPRVSDDLYRLRHFSISKGNVVNCGDSIISRRSRSNTSVNSTNSRASERSPFEGSCCGGGYANVDSIPPSPDDDDVSDGSDPPPPPRYRVVMLGDAGVGKTALVSQFMTSEYMHTYDASLDDEFGEKTVSVLLDDEESELVFIDHPSVEMSVENSLSTYEPHGCVIVFSIVDRSSFRIAEEVINYLWQENVTKDKAVILVGNKADLARSRAITAQEGKSLAATRDAKFIETSSGIQHNVDELLVGILKQMRLKESREKKASTSSRMKTSRTHISLHLAKELLQKICLTDLSKSKSCENLHVL